MYFECWVFFLKPSTNKDPHRKIKYHLIQPSFFSFLPLLSLNMVPDAFSYNILICKTNTDGRKRLKNAKTESIEA